jgi:hypothetical protein
MKKTFYIAADFAQAIAVSRTFKQQSYRAETYPSAASGSRTSPAEPKRRHAAAADRRSAAGD